MYLCVLSVMLRGSSPLLIGRSEIWGQDKQGYECQVPCWMDRWMDGELGYSPWRWCSVLKAKSPWNQSINQAARSDYRKKSGKLETKGSSDCGERRKERSGADWAC
ncbi:uncharacterized protein LY89DRAFT_411848 [Mollisia scopiformis]|uniref:Uncharacterized protein n=1 Tax=Mollisia scopiformis TaxID=149040 RepID=A0A132B1X0_MOLSC|nr:uncharacterized protein LY89DRAFT_411848 [Mollisia scopiformis]KUJ06388.1 hypothetical protein LY89DRAFT_411848 [Mollisia scopiformis]